MSRHRTTLSCPVPFCAAVLLVCLFFVHSESCCDCSLFMKSALRRWCSNLLRAVFSRWASVWSHRVRVTRLEIRAHIRFLLRRRENAFRVWKTEFRRGRRRWVDVLCRRVWAKRVGQLFCLWSKDMLQARHASLMREQDEAYSELLVFARSSDSIRPAGRA